MRSAIVIASMLVASAAMANDLSAAKRARLDAMGRAHLAEMMAFVRDGPDQCGEAAVPQMWPFAVLALYSATGEKAPLEDEIAAKQNELAAVKTKMGVAKWCALYYIEMKEAYTIVNLVR